MDQSQELIVRELQHLNDQVAGLADRDILGNSQAAARDTKRRSANTFRDRYRNNRQTAGSTRNAQSNLGGFLDEFEKSLIDGLLGSDFQSKVADTFSQFADAMGVSVKDIPGAIGKQIGKNLMDKFKSSKAGGKLYGNFQASMQSMTDKFKDKFAEGAKKVEVSQNLDKGLGAADAVKNTGITDQLSKILDGDFSKGIASFTKNLGMNGEVVNVALGGLKSGLSAVSPQLLKFAGVAGVALIALDKVTEAFGPLFEGIGAFASSVKKAANRENETRKASLKAEKDRIAATVETLVKTPFTILEDAAKKVEQAWDDSLKVITSAQGYTKSDVQDLMAVFADRIRQEGLTDVVAGTSVVENLSKVIAEGLSGKVAEEFAYQATLLNAAIPTQDFFGYAATYSSIAANAIKNGMSEAQAIQSANDSLNEFANSLLYASRELAGGYTTGLKNAQSLYEQAVKISQAAKIGDSSQIAGVFTSVAATIGAIAPDLANSITDVVYKAATGGNASDLVALRSLAGVNASNTEFLKALAKDPQRVFATLFNNLATMYTQSNDAFMEKAEGYAQLFGISSEAFQRIDFAYLAQAIDAMNTDSSALNQNMKLLASGQTTLTAEQVRNREINEYMINEGLSYVLDNEAAREIQKHMWDEQLAREMQETTYGVEIVGAVKELISGIAQTAKNILNIINPIGWFKKARNVAQSSREAKQIAKDIEAILESRKVGSGNVAALHQLTTTGSDLGVAKDLRTMLGTPPGFNQLFNPKKGDVFSSSFNEIQSFRQAVMGVNHPGSQYSWGTVSKSSAGALSTVLSNLKTTVGAVSTLAKNASQSATTSSESIVASKIQQMMSDTYLKDFINKENPKTYEDWIASGKRLGISDMQSAIESAGYTESQLKEMFESKEAEAGAAETGEMKAKEVLFHDTATAFIKDVHQPFLNDIHTPFIKDVMEPFIEQTFPGEYVNPLFSRWDTLQQIVERIDSRLTDGQSDIAVITANLLSQVDRLNSEYSRWINTTWTALYKDMFTNGAFKRFLADFTNYFINHTVYSQAYAETSTMKKIAKIQEKEKTGTGDAIYTLAEALTKNTTDLVDPTVQTNALLSQILIVLNAIMNQNNEKVGTLSLADSLSALSMGITPTV